MPWGRAVRTVGRMDVIFTAAGALLIAIVAWDLFHQIFHPEGTGTVSRAVMRGVFLLARHNRYTLGVAGPAGVVLTIVVWTALLALGFAFIFLPHLPEHFQAASTLSRNRTDSLGDALYLSLVTLSTLGYGDISPTATWLRILAPIEALMGFGLLSAGVTWVLSIYPVLGRRRSLAQQVALLTQEEARPLRALLTSNPSHGLQVVWDLTAQVIQTRSDLIQFPSSAYFHAPSEAASFPLALSKLRAAAEVVDEVLGAPQANAALLRDAIDSVAELLRERGLGGGEPTTAGVLRSYAAFHQRAPIES